jgi:transcriptional regulator with XRE-family HTH domain
MSCRIHFAMATTSNAGIGEDQFQSRKPGTTLDSWGGSARWSEEIVELDSYEEQLIQALAITVQKKRQALGVTQVEFAVYTRLGLSYYADLEQGRRSPTILTLRRLAQGFELDASHLLAFAERRLEGKRLSSRQFPQLQPPEWLVLEALSVVVRERRKALGLTQVELSQKAGLTKNYVCTLEQTKNISVKNLSKLSVALQVKASHLLALVEARARG